tara:strand:+ start:3083 stop:3532 length:450 start_codon:yes stop_codon:yes gene_type:complete
MNELIVTPDAVIVVGDAGSVSGILDDIVKANTIPDVRNEDGSIKTEAVVPDADTLAVEVTADELKTHAWRVPKAREERLGDIRAARNAKLFKLDDEANQALTGRPGVRAVADVEAERQVLRDLPPIAEAALAQLGDTEVIAAYVPPEIE